MHKTTPTVSRPLSRDLARIPFTLGATALAYGIGFGVLKNHYFTTPSNQPEIDRAQRQIGLLKLKSQQAHSDTISLDPRDAAMPFDVVINGIPAQDVPLRITGRASDLITAEKKHLTEIRQQTAFAVEANARSNDALDYTVLLTGPTIGIAVMLASNGITKLRRFHNAMGDMLYNKINDIPAKSTPAALPKNQP